MNIHHPPTMFVLATIALFSVVQLSGCSPAPGNTGAPSNEAARGTFVSQAVDRGDVVRTIQASGTLNAETQITVGAQTSGLVRRVLVDFNDSVRKGQLLAEIDTQVLQEQWLQTQAQTEVAKTKLEFAERNEARQKSLFAQGFIARMDLDDAEQSRLVAQATLLQQQAAMRQSETNLRNARIVSPIDGLVVSRSVNEGQTVAANFQTPELFKLAKNLRSMQIEVNISEADVGMVRAGVPVQFTVDAFPGRTFAGTLTQIRNNYTVVQNVVTYTAIVRADNPQDILRPGMTAYIAIEVERASAVLRVPNSALRYRPAGAPNVSVANAASGGANGNEVTVYRLKGNVTEPVRFTAGPTNSLYTAVTGDALRSGDLLVVGDRSSATVSGPPGFKLF
jgi:HlyD family secretion protein